MDDNNEIRQALRDYDAQLTQSLQQQFTELHNAVNDLRRQIGNVNESYVQTGDNTSRGIAGAGINQALIREAFLMEIIRANGLFKDVDLDAIEQKVRERYVTEQPGWGATAKQAKENLATVLGEISGD